MKRKINKQGKKQKETKTTSIVEETEMNKWYK